MKKYIYCVGLHKDGGLNILNKFLSQKKNDHILIIDSRIKNKINKKKISFLLKKI